MKHFFYKKTPKDSEYQNRLDLDSKKWKLELTSTQIALSCILCRCPRQVKEGFLQQLHLIHLCFTLFTESVLVASVMTRALKISAGKIDRSLSHWESALTPAALQRPSRRFSSPVTHAKSSSSPPSPSNDCHSSWCCQCPRAPAQELEHGSNGKLLLCDANP